METALSVGEWIEYDVTTPSSTEICHGQVLEVILSEDGLEPHYTVTQPIHGLLIPQSAVHGRIAAPPSRIPHNVTTITVHY